MTTLSNRISNVLFWVFYLSSLFGLFWLVSGGITTTFISPTFDTGGFVFICFSVAMLNVFWIIPQYLITGAIRILAPKISISLLVLTVLGGAANGYLEIQKSNQKLAAEIEKSLIATPQNCEGIKAKYKDSNPSWMFSDLANRCVDKGLLTREITPADPFANAPITATTEKCAALGQRVPPGNPFSKFDKLAVDCVAKGFLPRDYIPNAEKDPFADIPVTVKPEDRKKVDILDTCKRLDSHNLTPEEYSQADTFTQVCETLKKKGLY